MCLDFIPGCSSGGHCCSHSASILTCVCTLCRPEWCGNDPPTTTENSDTPPIHCAAICRYVHPASRRLKMRPDEMSEVVQQEYVVLLIGGAWLYPRVNVANTVYLSNHHSYCLHIQIRGRHLIADLRDK